ncbi:solute carrier family 17 member 9 [Cynoglossus semilaevis]|uniref:solute carrier family 17 member 9 n=1 Tax=Cynoglossus semilaevis TaxID=244447 RepID=UPI000496B2FD|nr:solute carrier family 17 member 9 [Cynoglossus semilaevis]XP_024915051.1 solute carrier family 17 member 9 [Cynoglossus semilaevis]
MADEYMKRDGWKHYNSSLQKHKTRIEREYSPAQAGIQNLWPRQLAQRWTLVLFVGTCLLYCARMAMPISAVTMAATFQWSKIDSGLVLGGFFWGYCFTQILGGHVSDKVGGERVLVVSTALWAMITIATPLLAHFGSHALFLMALSRFLMGVLQGVFFPSLASICSQRVLEGERGFLMSTMHSGCYMGTLVAGGMGSVILDLYGWQSLFYSFGVLSVLWALFVWMFFLKGEVTPKQVKTNNSSQWTWLRLLALLKNPPVWAMVFTHMCISCTSNTLLSWLPTYFKESFPHATSWVYNVVPWFSAIVSAITGGYVSDFLISRGYGISSVRKLMQFLSMGVSSMFLMLVCEKTFTSFTSALFFISVAVGLTTFTSCGVSVNVQDLTPSCAGALYGFMNMMGAFMGLLMVALCGYLIEVYQSWALVFRLIALVNSTGLGIFLLFGDAQRVDVDC